MRNWLRRWLGIEKFEADVNELCKEIGAQIGEVRGYIGVTVWPNDAPPLTLQTRNLNARCDKIEAIDGNQPVGSDGWQETKLGGAIAELQRAVGIGPEENLCGCRTIKMELEALKNRITFTPKPKAKKR